MAETIVLDPSSVAGGRNSLDITLHVKSEGIDWGDAEIEASTASMTVGERPVGSYRIPNRKITIPLVLKNVQGGTTFAAIRQALQSKVGLFQTDGGWIGRTTASGTLYADVVNASLQLGGSWLQAYGNVDIDAHLSLECVPDWYGDEVTLGTHTGSTGELIFTEPTVSGFMPGRVRILARNTSATNQNGLLWGIRSRHYGTATTEQLVYEAEALTPLDAATRTVRAGASGGTVVAHTTLPTLGWVPVLSTDISAGTASLTHKGTYRVWARAWTTSDPPQVRLAWDVGDLANPTYNAVTILQTSGEYDLLDLGVVQLNPTPVGPHRWQGVIQAQGDSDSTELEIDKIWLQPLDEYAGQLSAATSEPVGVVGAVSVPSTTADNAAVGTEAWRLTGAAPPAAIASANPNPAEVTHYLLASQFGFNVATGNTIHGIQVDINRWAWASSRALGGHIYDSRISLVKAGVVQTTNTAKTAPWPSTPSDSTYGGSTSLWGTTWTPSDINNTGFGVAISARNSNNQDITAYIVSIQITVYYSFGGDLTSVLDAVVYGSQYCELRTEGMFRQAPPGGFYAPVSQAVGDLPRMPTTGEGRTVQVFLKPTRGILFAQADGGMADAMTAQILYRPAYLFTP